MDPSDGKIRQPFSTIGVSTYNRLALLRQSISSLPGQRFKDFEVIIGNDYVGEPLTYEMIGTGDNWFLIVNIERNNGVLDYMNSILRLAKGRYFSWQFDNDHCS